MHHHLLFDVARFGSGAVLPHVFIWLPIIMHAAKFLEREKNILGKNECFKTEAFDVMLKKLEF